jgi:hypothetical protein
MHCEKNPCENVMKTMFGAKDMRVVWEDFKECGIHGSMATRGYE